MRLSLLAVGRLKQGPERELVERYRERVEGMARSVGISGFDLLEIPESKARRDDDRRRDEATQLLNKVGSSGLLILDEGGSQPTSERFAESIRQLRDAGRDSITFVIGGPDGLDRSVKARAETAIAFGRLTLPHQIVRALVCEQLYRALTIIAGHPYHRSGQA